MDNSTLALADSRRRQPERLRGNRLSAFEASWGLVQTSDPDAALAMIRGTSGLRGRLVYDSATADVMTLARAPRPSMRRLLYRAGRYDVHLVLMDTGSLVGNVLSNDVSEGHLRRAVCVLADDDRIQRSHVTANGDFHFEGISPGSFRLNIEGPEIAIDLECELDSCEEEPELSFSSMEL